MVDKMGIFMNYHMLSAFYNPTYLAISPKPTNPRYVALIIYSFNY
jgi:hypothetical protein